ncbi:MAG: type IX secretion system protein PorQ [Microscillaceae bacterium]|jgi:hypothetical protein|nr:type IX secretion system protein PorQ [Microscillaceae bacterium]
MLKSTFWLIFFNLIAFTAIAQVGGRNSFEFMRIPNNAFLAGIGGVNITTGRDEVNRFWQNPALLNDSIANYASFNYSRWQADIGQTTVSYVIPHKKLGAIGVGVHVVNYGEMPLTDPSGADLGTFRASDFAVNVGYSIRQDNFYFGANLKWLGSQIESYTAHAVVMDVGGIFKHPKKDLTLGLTLKNLGFVLKNYMPGDRTNLPLDIQAGVSFKPEYMPVRFSATLHHLYRFDIVYLDPNQSNQLDANGNPIVEEKRFFDKVARHFVLGGELLLSKNFNILLGYNHLINREMQVRDLSGFRGFSFGFRLKVKAFAMSFSHGTYHVGAGRSFFTLSANMNRILKKKLKKVSN